MPHRLAVVQQDKAVQGEMVRAFDICKNAYRMERQAEQGVTAASSGMRLCALVHHASVCSHGYH